MPRGLLSRLIVRLHRFVKDSSQAWKSGVVLERENSKALIEEEWGSKKLSIRASGPYRKELLTIIADEIERVTQTFSNLEVKKYVPCNCEACRKNGSPYLFPYENLRKRREKGIEEIICENELVNVNIFNMLEATFASVTVGLNLPKGETKEDIGKVKIFLSYSKKDYNMMQELRTAMATMRRLGEIDDWVDRHLLGGEEWNERIETELKAADIILFLVSNDFIDTNYIWDNERPIAMSKHQNKSAVVIPVILRKSDWEKTDFAKLNAVPVKGKPVTSFADKDEAYTEIAQSIRSVVEKIKSRRKFFHTEYGSFNPKSPTGFNLEVPPMD